MRIVCIVILALVTGCAGDDNSNPYGDVDRSGGDSSSGGDSGSGDPGGGGDAVPEITLNVTDACPAFTPCGGNEVGTWYVSDVCIEESVLFYDLFDYCGSAEIADIPEAPASGVVTFDGSWVDRYAVASITADILIPLLCGGCLCSEVDLALDAAGIDAACNSSCNASQQCECTIQADLVIDEAGAYTTNGNTITITGNGQTFDYCVTGNELKYIETTTADPEPGLYTLTRQ